MNLRKLIQEATALSDQGVDLDMKVAITVNDGEEAYIINSIKVGNAIYEDPDDNPLFDPDTMDGDSEEACTGEKVVFIHCGR